MAQKSTTIYLKDSMATIQQKLDSSTSVKFQKGIYKITKQLKLNSNTLVNLNGSTLRRCASIQSIFINKVTKNTTKYDGSGSIVIQNGIFEGMGGYSYDNLVTLFHAKDVRIENVTFKDSLCHGLEINSSCKVVVNDCKFLGYNLEGTDYSYRELIQIDHAGAGSFFLKGSSTASVCYDGTPCNNVVISNCLFNKSEFRDYPYACIGNHTQLYKGKPHTNITIVNNEFHCKQSSLKQPCLSFISMTDVVVKNNKFDCDCVARIYSKAESYKLSGTKVNYAKGDGVCSDINITDNMITCGQKAAFKQSYKSGKKHTKITLKPNQFDWAK